MVGGGEGRGGGVFWASGHAANHQPDGQDMKKKGELTVNIIENLCRVAMCNIIIGTPTTEVES